MATKSYFSNTTTIYKVNVSATICMGFIALVGLILIISPFLMYQFYRSFLDEWFDYPYLFVGIITAFFGVCFIFSLKQVKTMTRVPVLEINDEGIAVANLNNGIQNFIAYQNIEKLEMSEFNILGKKIRCINVIPVAGAAEKIIYRAKGNSRQRLEVLYKKYGAIEQIYSNLFGISIEAVYDDINTAIEEYKKNKRSAIDKEE